jgi:hypothetical protein
MTDSQMFEAIQRGEITLVEFDNWMATQRNSANEEGREQGYDAGYDAGWDCAKYDGYDLIGPEQ